MRYEPVKKRLGQWIRRNVLLRKVFYKIMGTLFLREWYVKRVIRNLDLKSKKNIEILDAGAGFGQYSYCCAKRFPNAKVLAIEINSDQVDDGNWFANKTRMNRLGFEKADITAINYQNRFDIVLAIDVLEHIEHDEDLLNRFFRALKSGGYLIVSTPSVYRRHIQDGEFVGEHFRKGYSEEEIRQKFRNTGFNLNEITYSYGLWGDFSWRLGIRNTIRLMGKGFLGKLLAPLYLVLVFPLVLKLMVLDYFWKNRKGTGFVIRASKSGSAR